MYDPFCQASLTFLFVIKKYKKYKCTRRVSKGGGLGLGLGSWREWGERGGWGWRGGITKSIFCSNYLVEWKLKNRSNQREIDLI